MNIAATAGVAVQTDWPNAIYRTLKAHGVSQVSYVPDAGHARLIELSHGDVAIQTTVLTTEEEGVALSAGAWLGGTLDTSASVVAAGALISDVAMKTGVIVKFSQNALIGVAAFILVVWWAYKAKSQTGGERPSAAIIWERFPKFVLGFLIASALFSFFLPAAMVEGTRSSLGELRTWWFALAFVCIGLETKFVDLATMEGGRPALAFLGAQAVNVVWTLILAYLIFGGVIFPVPDIK